MTCWEWVIIMVVFSLLSTLEALIITSAYFTMKQKLELTRKR